MAAEVNKSKSSIDKFKETWGLPLAILLAYIVWLLPTPPELSFAGKQALVLFTAIFILYLTEAIPLPIASLAVVPLAVLMKAVTLNVALQGFASSSVYLLVGAFVLATAMVNTGLAERITYWILSKIGCTATRITLGVMVANIFLAFLVPSSTARTAILLPVCLGIIGLFEHQGRSNFAIGLLLILSFTNATIASGIMTATVPNPVTVDFIAKAGGATVDYMQWLILGFPPALIVTLFTWWFIRVVFKPEVTEIPGGTDYIAEKLSKLGPIKSEEWKAMFVFALVVILWMTGGWTKMNPTTACLLSILLFFIPKYGIMTWKEADKGISWQIVLVAGGGIALGDILMKTGAAKWLAMTIFSLLGLHGASVIVILVVIMFILQYMHFLFVGTTAMATALLPIVLAMAEQAGVPAIVFALPAGMIIGGYPLLMFYCTLPNILIYGTGELEVGDFPKVGVVICAFGILVYAICAMTYWQWLGLFHL